MLAVFVNQSIGKPGCVKMHKSQSLISEADCQPTCKLQHRNAIPKRRVYPRDCKNLMLYVMYLSLQFSVDMLLLLLQQFLL